ncbi:MAG: cytochrome P450 [Bacteroidota bacterium]
MPIPKVKGHWLFGSGLEFAKDPIAYISKNSKQYGDFFVVDMRLSKFYISRHPEVFRKLLQTNHKNYVKDKFYGKLKLALGEGLLMNEGESWMRQRRLAQPAFYKKRLIELFNTMVDIAEGFCDDLSSHCDTGVAINITSELNRITSDIVVATLLGTGLNEDSQYIQDTILELQEYIIKHIRRPAAAAFAYVTGEHRRYMKKMAEFDASIYQIIEDRKKNPDGHNDLLSMLMAARDADTGEPMNNRQLRDEVITIYVAGHETSSNALSWTWYLLTKHPEVYQKVKQEVNEVLGDKRPDFETIMRLQYTRQVLDESMRFYPPAWATGREALGPDEILGHKFKKGDMFFMSIYELHRHPDYWENPDQFDPDRFSPDNRKGRPKFVYLPFGAGPRMCIGNNFAIMEIMLLMATMIRRYDYEILESHPVIPEPLVTLRPKHGVKLFVRSSL